MKVNKEWNFHCLLLVCIVQMHLVSRFVQLIVFISEKMVLFYMIKTNV